MKLSYLTVLQYDWLQFSRTRVFWLLNALLLLTGIYAAFYGRSQVQEQQQKIDLLKRDIDITTAIVAAKFKKQDTIASWHYDDWLYTLHANRPDGLSALAFGQRDLHRFGVSLAIGTYFYNRYAGGYENKTLSGEIANPQKQRAGHLDVSFVLVFLLPLYLILMSYNVLSGDQESGTLSLLALQPIGLKRVLLLKLGFRAWLTITAGWAIILLGAVVNGALCDPRLLYFLTGTLAYILCWSGLVFLVISFFRTSSMNALLLISLWLFFCFALPAAFTAVLNASYPPATKADLTAAVQKANARVFNTPRRALSVRFYQAYPQYHVVARDTFPGGWYNARWMRAVHLLLDDEVKPLEDHYQAILKNRIQATDKLDYYSPSLLAQSVFNRTAASDMEQMFNYDASIYTHFAAWRDYLDAYTYLHHDRLDRKGFQQLPRDSFAPVIHYAAIVYRLLALLGIATALFIISLVTFSKHEHDQKK